MNASSSPCPIIPSELPSFRLLQGSSLFQEFTAERDEIFRHKWLRSERVGKDIGFERALLEWIRYHRDDWRAARRATRERASGHIQGLLSVG